MVISMNQLLYEKALALQYNSQLGITKDEKDYAFTFIYPPSRALYDLKKSPYTNEIIELANLYIHIPYCTGRCSYCYFGCYNISTAPYSKQQYIIRLCKEMEMLYAQYGKIELLSIHFGGGTPSILDLDEIELIFNNIRKYFIVRTDVEITFECSPETITITKLKKLKECGVNRLNIGIQTLNDKLLKAINRRHNSQKAIEAINMAQLEGFENINVDIMYGLLGQTMEDWHNTLDFLVNMDIQSISTYRLRIHPNGKINDQVHLFDENKAIQMYIYMMDIMKEHSYYQCSSHKFAIKKEFAQKQIINKRGINKNTLIPIGMASYGFINNVIFWNERNMESYISKIDNCMMPFSIGYELNKEEQMARACVLGIHNVGGIDLIQYEKKFNETIYNRYGDVISNLQHYELLETDNYHLKLSELGMVFADEIALKFYSQEVISKLSSTKSKYGIFFDEILK